jgi:Glycosyltransferase family 87
MPIWRKPSNSGHRDPPGRAEGVERRDPAREREGRSLPYPSTPTTVLRNALVLSPLVVLLVLWMWIVAGSGSLQAGPNGVIFANSFGTYLGAAEALKEGHNPWDPAQAYHAEKQMLLPQGVEVNEPVWNRHIGNPPLFLWALEPLTNFPFRVAALLWVGAMYALAAAGFLVSAKAVGWRRPVFACVIFLMMPQVVVGAYYGEAYALLFAALALGLVLAPRHPRTTGALLAVAILKPPIGLPLAMLIWIFHVRDKRRCAAAFVGTNALALGLTVVFVGPHSLSQWLVGLAYFSHDMSAQPHVASLIGVYVGWAPTALRSLLEVLTILFACLLTALVWRRRRVDLVRRRRRGDEVTPFRAVAWLWFVWFLASPYSHFYDELMLAIPILVLFGPNGGEASKPIPAAALYAALFSLLVVSWMPLNVSLLPVPLALVGYFLFRAARQVEGAPAIG